MRSIVLHFQQLSAKLIIRQMESKLTSIHSWEGSPNLCLYFGSVEVENQEVLNFIQERFPNIQLLGCTSYGQLSSVGQTSDDGTVVAFLRLPESSYLSGQIHRVSENPLDSVETQIRKKLSENPTFTPASLLILSSSLKISGVKLLNHLKQVFGQQFPIFGGIAADDLSFKRLASFYGNEITTDSAQFLFLNQNITLSHGIENGFTPGKTKYKVTRATGNRVYEIDGKSAYTLYEECFGDGIVIDSQIPLAVYEDSTEGGFYLRDPLYVDHGDNSLVFAGDIPEGVMVSFARSDHDSLTQAAENSMERALTLDATENHSSHQPFAICISCAGRKMLLGGETEVESRMIQHRFPEMNYLGFYSYGEISPLNHIQQSNFHNQTFVSLILKEKKAA
jgi:hypothetical protein